MAKISVSTNLRPILFIEVNLQEPEWSSLLFKNLSSFKMEELRRPCGCYENGIFPGSTPYGENKQITRIQKFPNYVEFCKVVADEVIPINGQLYLTSKFYDQRKEGWGSSTLKKKEGEVIGYCLNGDIYCSADKHAVNRIFYHVVYKSLISRDPAYMKLQQCLRDGVCIQLSGEDEEFLQILSNVLLNKED